MRSSMACATAASRAGEAVRVRSTSQYLQGCWPGPGVLPHRRGHLVDDRHRIADCGRSPTTVVVVKVDPEELVDSGEVASILGLSSPKAVSTYRARYSDFPEPVVTKASGKCVLWLRSDVDAWVH